MEYDELRAEDAVDAPGRSSFVVVVRGPKTGSRAAVVQEIAIGDEYGTTAESVQATIATMVEQWGALLLLDVQDRVHRIPAERVRGIEVRDA